MKHWIALVLALVALPAFAQQGAIITALQGRVTVEQGTPAPTPAAAFSRLKAGDKLQLAADAVLQVVYFGNGRQESWRGAARFEIGETESKPAGTATPAEVKQLPQMLVRQLVKTPTADASGRIGAVRMRSIAPPDAAQKLEENYKGLRAQLPAADRTPELYLLAGLFELKEYDRVEAQLKRWSDEGASDADFVAMREHYAAAVREARAK